ncbi:MAG: heparinase II/III family protein, partial [Candidatus Cloacimonetes bacterium]|nr:heparinase II/III family protein [Candidatus Cloacimonadota bacterium]
MKTLVSLIISIISCGFMYAQTFIDRSITIDAQTLTDIRSSISDSSSEYYDHFLNSFLDSARVRYEDDDMRANRYVPGQDYLSIRNSAYKLGKAMFGTNQLSAISGINDELYSISDDYLTILEDSFKDTSVESTDRALKLSYLAINTSMLYDCLYYYYSDMDSTNTYYHNLCKLKNIMLMCKDIMLETEAYYDSIFANPSSFPTSYKQYQHGYWAHDFPASEQPDYPGFSMIQYRLGMYGALGLTALLLSVTDPSMYDEMSDIVAYVDSQLVSTNVPITFLQEHQKAGMLYFHTSKSGAYFEGVNYMGFLIAQLAPYFVARNRLSAGSTNYFNNQYIISWICDVTQKLSPTGEDWAYNDAKYIQEIEPSVAYAFYQNTSNNQSIDPKCSWYIRTKKDLNSDSYKIISSGWLPCNFFVQYLSNPYKQPKILNYTEVPNSVGFESWSNSEFSVLTKVSESSAFTSQTYHLKPTLKIVHENSFSGYHDQADQSSFSFFYKGKQFLIDPGYYRYGWDDGRKYCRSPYAHNMLIVNPSDTVLSSLLNNQGALYRPISAFNSYDEEAVTEEQMIEDPCIRDYFQKSPNLDLLKLRLGYRNAEDWSQPLSQQNVIALLSRSFVRDDDLFIIFDDVESVDEENFYDYWNLLHFGVGDTTSVVLTGNVISVEKDEVSNCDYVDIACGSLSPNYSLNIDTSNRLPNDYRLGYASHYQGKQVAIAAQDPKFITVLAPRSGGTSRVLESVTVIDSIYCTAVTCISSSVPATETLTLIGCTDGADQAIDILDNAIETDGKLFVVTKYRDTPSISLDRSIVLLNGEYLQVDDTDLLRLCNSDIKGISASYMQEKLDVVCHDTSISHPRFKIYRSGADPDQFSAIMRTQLEPQIPEPIPNPDPNYRFSSTDILQSLAYDDQYFYVNYAWADLEAAGLINDDLTIAMGTIPQTQIYTGLNIQGNVEITGNITIVSGASMDIGPNSSVLISGGVRIHNYGLLTIDGGDSRSITMDTSNQQWSGIVTYQNAYLFCNNAIIES